MIANVLNSQSQLIASNAVNFLALILRSYNEETSVIDVDRKVLQEITDFLQQHQAMLVK